LDTLNPEAKVDKRVVKVKYKKPDRWSMGSIPPLDNEEFTGGRGYIQRWRTVDAVDQATDTAMDGDGRSGQVSLPPIETNEDDMDELEFLTAALKIPSRDPTL
jgi:hypothetical protein